MPFIILSCPAPIEREQCEDRIRTLLSAYGQVGSIIVAERTSPDLPWVAAVEMRSGKEQAVAALQGSTLDGAPLRIRAANPLDSDMLLRA